MIIMWNYYIIEKRRLEKFRMDRLQKFYVNNSINSTPIRMKRLAKTTIKTSTDKQENVSRLDIAQFMWTVYVHGWGDLWRLYERIYVKASRNWFLHSFLLWKYLLCHENIQNAREGKNSSLGYFRESLPHFFRKARLIWRWEYEWKIDFCFFAQLIIECIDWILFEKL
jgi:hypothetical protein